MTVASHRVEFVFPFFLAFPSQGSPTPQSGTFCARPFAPFYRNSPSAVVTPPSPSSLYHTLFVSSCRRLATSPFFSFPQVHPPSCKTALRWGAHGSHIRPPFMFPRGRYRSFLPPDLPFSSLDLRRVLGIAMKATIWVASSPPLRILP